MRVLFAILLSLSLLHLPAQDLRYAGPGPYETAVATCPAAGGGSWLLGTQGQPPAGHTDLWLLRLGPAGDSLWSRTYGGPGDETAVALLPLPDSGLLVLGHTTGTGEQDLWLLRLDALGAVQWAQTWGGPAWEEALALVPGAGGSSFVVAMQDRRLTGRDLWILHVSASGSLQQARHLGGPGWDEVTGAAAAPAGGLALTWVRDSLAPYRITWLDSSLTVQAETAFAAGAGAPRSLVRSGARWWTFGALNQLDSLRLIAWIPGSPPSVQALAVADTPTGRLVTVIDAQAAPSGGAWVLAAEAYTDTVHLLRLNALGQVATRQRWRPPGRLRSLGFRAAGHLCALGQAQDATSAADALRQDLAPGQPPLSQRYGRRGPAGEETGLGLWPTGDGDYWLGGYALGDSLRQRAWLLRLDPTGAPRWTYEAELPGAAELVALTAGPASSAWALILTRTAAGRGLAVQRIDATGQRVAQGHWPGETFFYPYGGIAPASGGARVFTSEAGPGGVGSVARLLAFGPGGDTLWSRRYFPGQISRGNALAALPGGDLLLAGQVRVAGGTYRGFLMRVDSLGLPRWTQTYTRGSGFSWARVVALAPLPGGGAWLAATLQRSDGSGAWLLRVDAAGDTLFTRFYPSTGGAVSDATALWAEADGGVLLVGTQDSVFLDRPATYADARGWARRVDAQGHTQWRQEVGPGPGLTLSGVAPAPGAGWWLLGQVRHPAYADALLYRRDAAGLQVETLAAGPAWTLFPNPSREHVWLRRPPGPVAAVRLFDAQGRTCGRWTWPPGTETLRLDLPGLAPGVYFLQLSQAGSLSSQRLVLLP